MESLWHAPPYDVESRLRLAIHQGLECRAAGDAAALFFRADDIGVPGRRFERLMALFVKYRVPLALALVPAWLTPVRWRVLEALQKDAAPLFCWHQHGWRHVNHETAGKKQEFGPARSRKAIKRDLASGKDRLVRICQEHFTALFTPPWNRCSTQTLTLLKTLSFKAVSRSIGNRPLLPPGLPEIPVDLDLHTRKEPHPRTAWSALFSELAQALARGRCGIMIHHQHMNDAAFDFLELLLQTMVKEKDIYLLNLKGLWG